MVREVNQQSVKSRCLLAKLAREAADHLWADSRVSLELTFFCLACQGNGLTVVFQLEESLVVLERDFLEEFLQETGV